MSSGAGDSGLAETRRLEIATPSAARSVVREAIRSRVEQDLLDTALLLVSEIVGNAVRHGRPPVVVAVLLRRSLLRVEVDDADPRPPQLVEPGLLEEGGRGIWLVDAMSTTWGVDEHPRDGKTVWFELAA